MNTQIFIKQQVLLNYFKKSSTNSDFHQCMYVYMCANNLTIKWPIPLKRLSLSHSSHNHLPYPMAGVTKSKTHAIYQALIFFNPSRESLRDKELRGRMYSLGGRGRAIVIGQRDEERTLWLWNVIAGNKVPLESIVHSREEGGEAEVPPCGTLNSSDRGDTGILKATFSSSRQLYNFDSRPSHRCSRADRDRWSEG